MSILGFFLAVLLGLGASSGGGAKPVPTIAPAPGSADAGEPADSTDPRGNIKQLVNAIESCAATRVDGSYTGSTGADCLDPATLQEMESSLAQLDIGRTAPAPGGFQVAPIGAKGQGYFVQAAVPGDPIAYFVEKHLPSGQLYKLCGESPYTADGTVVPEPADVEGCDDGKW